MRKPAAESHRVALSLICAQEELSLWFSGLRTDGVSARVGVQSLASISRLRIRRCHKLQHRSRMQLRSGIAVAVTSICHRCGREKKKKKKKKKKCLGAGGEHLKEQVLGPDRHVCVQILTLPLL